MCGRERRERRDRRAMIKPQQLRVGRFLVRQSDEAKISAPKQKSWLSAYVLMNQILDPFSIYSHGHNTGGFLDSFVVQQ